MTVIPSAQDTLRVLQGLACGKMSPKEASAWARQFVVPFNPDIAGVVGEVLDYLLGADGIASEGNLTSPLFTQEAFAAWLERFRPALEGDIVRAPETMQPSEESGSPGNGLSDRRKGSDFRHPE